jgi:hypothetical protein
MRATNTTSVFIPRAADSCSYLSKFRAYEEPAPCSAQRLPQFMQRYGTETVSAGQKLKAASLLQHEILTDAAAPAVQEESDYQ